MIKIFKPNETDFRHNGLGVLDNIVKSATITRKLNDTYMLEIEVIKDKRGKYKYIQMHSVIEACGQLFRVYSQDNIQENDITVKATLYHITYDINLDIVDDNRAVDCRANEAVKKVVIDKRFTVIDTDIETINTAYFVNEAPFAGIQKKILERWGGELYQDNFKIGVLKTIGKSSPVSIAFRKNIQGFTQRLDYTGVYTRVKVKGRDGLTIGGINNGNDWLESPNIKNYFKPLSAVIEYDSDNPLELKKYVLESLWGTVDIPKVEFTVNFIDLSQTKEYKRFSNLKELDLGDTATVYHEVFDVNLKVKVQQIVRNALTNTVTSIVLGHYIPDYVERTEATMEETVNKTAKTIIRQTDTKIELLAEDMQEQIDETGKTITELRTSLTQTADSITAQAKKIETINGTVKEHSTTLSQTAEKLEVVATAQENGELRGKTYTFDGNGFTIGATNGSTTAVHTNDYSRWKHSNGNYSEANSSGFSRDGRPYHHLISIGSAIVGGSAGVYPSVATIYLPDHWKGKQFSASVSMVDTAGGIADEWVKRTYLAVTEINTAEGYFKVRGYWTALNSTKVTNEKELTFSYIAIGG